MARTRLRKTFQRESDEEGDEPDAMDEEEQDELIQRLKKENDDKNESYMLAFLAMPMISSFIFFLGLIRNHTAQSRLACLLGITSLWATAYNLAFIPTKAEAKTDAPPSQSQRKGNQLRIPVVAELSPAQRYVPILNGVLSLLLALYGPVFRDHKGVLAAFWLFCEVPLLEYAIIQAARHFILEVDPLELRELKYDYKGA